MKEYNEDEYLMISGIQHFEFCRRQWALIHIEQQWEENVRTVEGNIMHKKAHDGSTFEKRNNIIISRGMPIFSKRLGVSGICDIVEFHRVEEGITLFNYDGKFEVFPIEYKKGVPKKNNADVLQLVAQAVCLEEMLECKIKKGALYYGETKRRMEVDIDESIKKIVEDTFLEMHKYFDGEYTPKAKWSKACNACSLIEICMPQLGKQKSVKRYVTSHIQEDIIDEKIT